MIFFTYEIVKLDVFYLILINSLWLSDTIWHHRSGSTLNHVTAGRLFGTMRHWNNADLLWIRPSVLNLSEILVIIPTLAFGNFFCKNDSHFIPASMCLCIVLQLAVYLISFQRKRFYIRPSRERDSSLSSNPTPPKTMSPVSSTAWGTDHVTINNAAAYWHSAELQRSSWHE